MKKSNDMIDQCLGNFIVHFMSLMILKVMYLVYLVDILQLNISEKY
jgi:hypothetical protein